MFAQACLSKSFLELTLVLLTRIRTVFANSVDQQCRAAMTLLNKNFLHYFYRKQVLTFHVNCLLGRWFTWKIKTSFRGGWVQSCRVYCGTGMSNWYWLTVGQGLLSLQQVRVEGEGFFYFFCFFTFSFFSFSSVSLFHLLYYLFYISSPFLWEMTQYDPQGLTCR